jgi:acyl phosphate:glycerol-3-phosphate acyltransferase
MGIVTGIVCVVAGYLIGSFPTAFIITRIKRGVDIRDIDVGNMGAAAVIRQMGLLPGLLVAVVDMVKGSSTVLLAQQLSGADYIWVYAAGFAAILGHCFPIYIGFRGGQGTATIIGIFSVLAPVVILIMLPIMAILLLITRRIFPMVIASSPALPLLTWFIAGSLPLTIYAIVIIMFMVSRNTRGISSELIKLKGRYSGSRGQMKKR